MQEKAAPPELTNHLCRSSRLTAQEAEHVVNEVLAFFDETADVFLRRRHKELQTMGLSNSDIYASLQTELKTRRFTSKSLTTRQIRRAIYG